MLTIRDAEDSYNVAKMEWESFIQEFKFQWNMPKLMENIVMGLSEISPEQRASINPDSLGRLEQFFGGKQNAR